MLDDYIRKLKQPLSALLRQTFIGGYQAASRDTLAWLIVLEKAYAVEHAQEAAKEKLNLTVPSVSQPTPVSASHDAPVEKSGGLNG